MHAAIEPTVSTNDRVRYMDIHWFLQQHVFSVYL